MPNVFRMATFNVNSVKSRLPVLDFWLDSPDAPDVVCLQETKCQDADFPASFFADKGYAVAFKGMKSYNGVAVFSKEPLEEVAFGFDDGADSDSDRARVVRARVGDVHIVNTYVPQGKSIESPDFEYKLRFFERILALFERDYRMEDKLLWTGDLNVAPTDRDVTHPENKRDHVCFHRDVQHAFEEVCSWGLVDVFRKHRNGDGEFSFWDYRVKDSLARNIGWRIDHLLATPSLAERSRDAYAVRELRAMERPSDHTAVVGVWEAEPR